jgi:ABC-type branched-subunit amino acid transport system ATPase component
MNKLAIRNLSISYKLQRQTTFTHALDQVNFTVSSGEFVTIVGPSGCGKGKAHSVLDPTQNVAQLQLLYTATAAPLIVTNREYRPVAEAIVNATNSTTTAPPQIWCIESLPVINLDCPTISIPADTIAGVHS